jgi:Arc/MetJ-type ribon-helix-helix transcriptional regulator
MMHVCVSSKSYYTFSIPLSLKEKVEAIVRRRKDLAYSSVAEFMKDAVRRHIERIESEERAALRNKVPNP